MDTFSNRLESGDIIDKGDPAMFIMKDNLPFLIIFSSILCLAFIPHQELYNKTI